MISSRPDCSEYQNSGPLAGLACIVAAEPSPHPYIHFFFLFASYWLALYPNPTTLSEHHESLGSGEAKKSG